jgi:hypothetical protein
MLISRKSRGRDDPYQSRFKTGEGVQFPLRQYLRCREDLFSGSVHLLILVAFTVTMIVFARTIDGLFVSHGSDLNPWYRRGALVVIIMLVLSLLRRIWKKFIYLRETLHEMRELRDQFRSHPDQDSA